MDEREFRVMIKHYFLIGKTATEAKKSLDEDYPNTAPSFSTIKDWYAKFRTGDLSTKGDKPPND